MELVRTTLAGGPVLGDATGLIFDEDGLYFAPHQAAMVKLTEIMAPPSRRAFS